MPSMARQVRDALAAEIRKVDALAFVGVGSEWRHWRQQTNFPAAYLIREGFDKERGPTQSKEVIEHYRIAFVLNSANPEDDFDELAADTEEEIEDDPTLGGLVLDTWVYTCTGPDTGQQIRGTVFPRDIFVDVLYRHERGSP